MTAPAGGVSVVCTARNAAPTIARSIASVRAQDMADWEMVVVDDGSSDATAAIVAAQADADPRIRLVRTEGVGRGRALNLALAQARFPLVANLDADDDCHPSRLARQRAAMAAHPGFALLCTDYLIVHDDEPCVWEPLPARSPPPREITRRLVRHNPVIHSSVMLRAEALRAVGGYREDLRTHFDYDLWIRLAAAGQRLGRLDLPLASKRLHAGQSFERRRRIAYLANSAGMQLRAIRTLGGWGHLPLVAARFAWGLVPDRLRGHFGRALR